MNVKFRYYIWHLINNQWLIKTWTWSHCIHMSDLNHIQNLENTTILGFRSTSFSQGNIHRKKKKLTFALVFVSISAHWTFMALLRSVFRNSFGNLFIWGFISSESLCVYSYSLITFSFAVSLSHELLHAQTVSNLNTVYPYQKWNSAVCWNCPWFMCTVRQVFLSQVQVNSQILFGSSFIFFSWQGRDAHLKIN